MYSIENIAGAFYVRKDGVLSATRCPTFGKAEQHKAKLEKGLVHFVPFKGPRQHRPAFKPGFQNYAGSSISASY